MISDRPYRLARSPQEAFAELGRCAGTQFDPAVVGAFEDIIGRLEEHAMQSGPRGNGSISEPAAAVPSP